MTERELIAGCVKKSLKHQRELYDRYVGFMMGICMRYAASESHAEDLLQEAFLRIFGKIETYSGKGELGAWIRKIVINVALMDFRKQKRQLAIIDSTATNLASGVADDAFGHLSAKDLMLMVQKLPDGCRVVFNLYAVEGYNHREIAHRLSVSVGTSKSQYSRARMLLRAMIEKEERMLNG